jgi:hypothetical protein
VYASQCSGACSAATIRSSLTLFGERGWSGEVESVGSLRANCSAGRCIYGSQSGGGHGSRHGNRHSR